MTKSELEKQVKELKNENYDLKDKLLQLESSANSSDLKELGFSVVKLNGTYKLVEIKFDLTSKLGKVVDVRDISKNSRDFSIAEHFGMEFFVRNIMEPLVG